MCPMRLRAKQSLSMSRASAANSSRSLAFAGSHCGVLSILYHLRRLRDSDGCARGLCRMETGPCRDGAENARVERKSALLLMRMARGAAGHLSRALWERHGACRLYESARA